MMPNKKYISGRNFEYTCRRKLEALGYYVIRSAGSKGVADLVAIAKHDSIIDDWYCVILVQCKNNGVISKKERQTLVGLHEDLAGSPIPVIAYKNKSRRTVFENAVTGEKLFEMVTKNKEVKDD